MRGTSSGAAVAQALGDAVTGGRGTVAVVAEPRRMGFIAWRSLTRPGEGGRHTTLVAHAAAGEENRRWKGLVAHWIDGCPCAACAWGRGEG